METTISFEIARLPEEFVEVEFIEADFEPKPRNLVNRKPTAGQVTMPLEKWLALDQKLHQLYNFCEIATMQRDEAKKLTAEEIGKNLAVVKDARDWKIYSERLEKKLLAVHQELFELDQVNTRLSDTADEALNLPILGRGKRKKELQKRVKSLTK